MTAEYTAACSYIDRGWSVLPMRLAEKKPAVRWKRYQRRQASPTTVRNWFRNTDHGVAVVFGHVSGGLCSRDFDDVGAYDRWAHANRTLADDLPTVATRRGYHVYAQAWPESVVEARQRLGKSSDAVGALAFSDGELRAGIGCYSVLPPSVHPSGHVYGWRVPLPTGELPTIDVLDAGFVEIGGLATRVSEMTERTQSTERTEEIRVGAAVCSDRDAKNAITAEEALSSTLPTAPGQRHRQVFELARALKAVPEYVDADPLNLRGLVQKWHSRCLPHISTKPFEETWIDFLDAWPRVQFPKGSEPMAMVFERACSAGIPDVAERYEQHQLQLLVAVCRELQRSAGNGSFYLSCRTAGRLVEVDHVTANRWLFLLTAERVLKLVEKGGARSRRASRYRYLGDL